MNHNKKQLKNKIKDLKEWRLQKYNKYYKNLKDNLIKNKNNQEHILIKLIKMKKKYRNFILKKFQN